MTQEPIKFFLAEIYSKPLKKKYVTNKTDVNHVFNIWSLDKLDLKKYGPENNRGYRYVLVVIDSFSKFGLTVPHWSGSAQTIKDSFEKILKNSKKNQIYSKPIEIKDFIKLFFTVSEKKHLALFKKQLIWQCSCRTLQP